MILFLFSTILFIYFLHEIYWKRRNLPPGPTPIPFIGNLLELKKHKPGYQAFANWTKQYGGVFTLWLGMDPVIIITNYEKIKETFIRDGDTYVDKKLNSDIEKQRGGNYGVLDTNGEMWSVHRRFALTQLRDLGFGKDLMQMKILLEIEELHKELDTHLGKSIDLPTIVDRSVGNVINLTLFGYRFEKEHADKFDRLKNLIRSQRDVVAEFRYFIQFLVPWTSKFLPAPSLADKNKKKRAEFDQFFMDQIEEHSRNIDFDAVENSDFIEAFLKEQKKREAEGDMVTFCNKQLAAMCFDLWIAGLLTTTMTLTWGMAYVFHDPEVQRKIHEELDRVVGDRLVSTADKNDLIYLNAFINETQRCANIIPLNLVHRTTRDTNISGFDIKKGTGIIAQISAVMTDENVFPDPFKFNPDRFIENGKLKKVDELVPFSVGKRQCLGEGLARMELFLFFGNLFNRYKITPDELPSLDKSQDNFVLPRRFNAVLEKRH